MSVAARCQRSLVLAVAGVAALTLTLPAAAASAPGAPIGELRAVDSRSAADAWAVGSWRDGAVLKTLVTHWGGASWAPVASPSPGLENGSLLAAVSARGVDDVWAVGFYGAVTSHGVRQRTLVEHWDGDAWTQIPSPNVSGKDCLLTGVSAVAADDVWAVGMVGTGESSFIEHWDGVSWEVVDSPDPGTGSVLAAVTARSATNAWAVGSYENDSTKTLIEHWDGSEWSQVDSVDPGASGNRLAAVHAGGQGQVWAVGTFIDDDGLQQRTLIEHWDGHDWTVTRSASPGGSQGSTLTSVNLVSADEAWAVGSFKAPGGAVDKTLILRWDGTRWTRVASPDPASAHGSVLTGVGSDSADSAWAVGFTSNINSDRQLKLRWDGNHWVKSRV